MTTLGPDSICQHKDFKELMNRKLCLCAQIIWNESRPAALSCRYYRDRLSVPRGPCNISVLRECWVHGVIDDGTLVWGQGLADWLPVKNVRTLVPQIRTVEGQCFAGPTSHTSVCSK